MRGGTAGPGSYIHPIIRIMHFYDSPKKWLKPLVLSKLGSFGYGKTVGGMVGRCMPSSGHGGCSGIRFMVILGSYTGSHFSNIGDFNVYGGI